ncbi:MAG: RelA/SpoT domain-containing protein [Candidatus Thermoplasmatota archaeon]|nr:RelA/SpoT domain-containing protein [Candidatus Thermoplasmatota archaeon]
MNSSDDEDLLNWLKEQIEEFQRVQPVYEKYSTILKQVLGSASRKYAPLAIIQTRPKAVASFGEKAIRKKHKYDDPVHQLTDLCGGRVITTTVDQVRAISSFIEDHFEVDWDNTLDVSQRHATAEFGYRSIHYIIKMKKGVFPNDIVPIQIPEEIYGLKAEVQVRTILEHAWADFYHDTNYKGAFKIPDKWDRELYSIAAMLEGVDKSFERINSNLRRYAANYGSYMTKEEMRYQIRQLATVMEYDPENLELAQRIGKLAIELEDWDRAIEVLSKFRESGHSEIYRDLGVAMCKSFRDDKSSKGFIEGQDYLERACKMQNADVDALSSLAGTWRGIDDGKAKELYLKAFTIDPTDPYPLGNFIEMEIIERGNISCLPMMEPVIRGAIQRSLDQIDVSMNLPWAYYDIGKFYLFLKMPYESLSFYTKAVQVSKSPWEIETSLRSLAGLEVVKDQLPGYQWARILLALGLFVKSTGKKVPKLIKEYHSPEGFMPKRPIVIVAGGCDAEIEEKMLGYRDFLLHSFEDFTGTIISGGTRSGVSGLVGEISSLYKERVHTIGYVPSTSMEDIEIDSRYNEIRKTDDDSFSLQQPLQYWVDIVLAGVDPEEVKVVGIHGGRIASYEYRLALAMGADVGVVQESGGEANKIFMDRTWKDSRKLGSLDQNTEDGKKFLEGSQRT